MRTALIAALAALGLAGCSLTIDPDGVEPPKPKPPVLGACIDGGAGSHKLCGGRASAGALPSVAATQHTVKRGTVDAGGEATISSSSLSVQQGIVSP